MEHENKNLMEICKTCLCNKYEADSNARNSEKHTNVLDDCIYEAKSRHLYNNRRPLNLNDVLVYGKTHNGDEVIQMNRQQR